MSSPSDYLRRITREYAIYVAINRAIPSVQDGLKTVQKNALWLLRNKAGKIKTFALTGEMGATKIHSHGEKSANDAIGLLAAPFMNNACLIEGHGAFGSRCMPSGEGIGAPRYTSVSRAAAAEALLYCDLDLVPLIDNYDGSNVMPAYFLPLIPVVLLNGVKGIAVGYSTDIQPHALRDLIEATKSVLLDRPMGPLMPSYSRYDITVTPTGKPNQYEYTGKVEILDSSTIRVIELPPGMSLDSFRKKLTEMEMSEHIVSFTDRSTDQINIWIKMKRGSIKDWKHEKAIDFFKIREKVTERIVVIDWGGNSIRTYDTAGDLVRDFAAWRLGWYRTRYEKRLRDASYELAYWVALDALFRDNFGSRLGRFVDRHEVEADVQETVTRLLGDPTIDESQLDRIVSLPTYRWTADYHTDVRKEIAKIEAMIAEYRQILDSPDRLRDIYVSELDGLKKLTR